MASYNDAYDSRPRPSRRIDSYPRPRDDYYLKPTAGANETRRRVGETASEGQAASYRSQRSPNRYAYDRYDPRDEYPPPLPPDTGRPPRREASRVRKRRSWPPQPICEDEVASLVKEADSQKLLKELSKDEVPSRGAIDQEPMVEDVPELINKNERRFVFPARDQPTPPTSEDEKARRKARRRPSTKLDMKFSEVNASVPEMGRRTASPYTFANTTPKIEEEVSGRRFLSPEDMLSPPPTDSNSRGAIGGSRSQPASPRRDSARYSSSSRPCNDYFSLSSESAIEDDDYYPPRARPTDKPATWPPSRDAPNSTPQTSVVDFAPQPSSMPVRRLNLDARRNTDTESTLPTMQKLNVEKSRRLTPLKTASALSGLAVPMVLSPQATLSATDYVQPRSRDSSYVSSKGPSPAGSTVSVAESATYKRSPRVSSEYAREDDYDRPPTRESSVSSSRPQSPSPRTPNESPRLPKTELDWSTLLAANTKRRSVPPSRLSSYAQQESTPPPSRGNVRPPYAANRVESLPYPVDDGPSTPTVWMPSERKHQYFPDSRPNITPSVQEPKTVPRVASPAPGSSAYPSTSSARAARPSMPTRYSAADIPQSNKQQQPERSRANESKRTVAVPSSQTKKDLQALAKKGLPPCARMKPIAGYSDWYTLTGAPTLDFCPDCICDVFDRTIYRNMFRRSPPRSLDTGIRCALGGIPWIRLAWLMTLQQQRLDLRLLEDLAEVEETSTPCTGDNEAARTWYGLRDKDGIFVKDFRMCYSDVRKVECLMPSLSRMFVRLPQRTADEMGVCAIRPEGNRFSIYIDALLTTHEKAMAGRTGPDPSPFISLVQWRSQLRECTKDQLLRNGLWHFTPNLPELTICEDCFATVVEPEVEKNNDIAMRFNRTIQPVYGEGIGSSCQLYSPRMRKVFERAIRNKDFKYLARKAKERREAELRLQERYKAVVQKAKRVSWGSVDSQEDERRLEKEIRRITQEWQLDWE